ncbi:MAG: hypothetical protein PHI06_05565 [Desulfobulbaceae bacterium]|nr:hypothetical protein [Desulfobulbaceae bacterium]
MTDKTKIEVNLEMCSGFFRIPTDDIVYNITVLPSTESSTTKVIEKIIEVEKIVEVEKKIPAPAPSAPIAPAAEVASPTDDYYKHSAQKLQQEISRAATESNSAPSSAGGVDINAIHDLAAMASDLKEVLQTIKKHPQASGGDSAGSGPASLSSTLELLHEKISQAKSLCAKPSKATTTPAATTAATPAKTTTRYLFNLDTVFQTIYELCTNETVKTHIKNARAKAEAIFDKEIFYNTISPKVSNYPEDDGFMNVPMSDVYSALRAACSDTGISNLLVKMDKQQADIFLDQFLLMEIPPTEEVLIAGGNDPSPDEDGPAPKTSADGDILSILNECQVSLDKLISQSTNQESPAPASQEELIDKIDDAFSIAASIQHDAKKLAETHAEGDADPLWLKIKGLAVLAESMLNAKAADPSLSYESGLRTAEDAAQQRIAEITPKPKAPASPPPKKEAPPPAPENFGEASQDDIDRLLEELG